MEYERKVQLEARVSACITSFVSDVSQMLKESQFSWDEQEIQLGQTLKTSLLPIAQKISEQPNTWLANILKATSLSSSERKRKKYFLTKDLSVQSESQILFPIKHMDELVDNTQEYFQNPKIQFSANSSESESEPEHLDISIEQKYFHFFESQERLSKKGVVQKKKLIKGTRGRKPIDPYMERELILWLNREFQNESYLTQKIIRNKAKKLSREKNFKASKGWLQKFFKRQPQLCQKYNESRRIYDYESVTKGNLFPVVKMEQNFHPIHNPVSFQSELMKEIKKESIQNEIFDSFDLY